MFSRMGFRPMLVCSALLALAQAAPAQIKIAVVNMQQAVYATAEVKKADADLQLTLKPKQEQAQKLQTDLQAIQQQLQAGGNKLTEQQQEDLNTEGQRKQRELQRLTTELQEAADSARQDILPKCTQRMKEVVKKLAAEKGYDLIVDTSVTYFIQDRTWTSPRTPRPLTTRHTRRARPRRQQIRLSRRLEHMAGYLDHYGAGEERRENIVKRALIALAVAIVVGGPLFYIFYNVRQEHQLEPVLLTAGGARLQRRVRALGMHGFESRARATRFPLSWRIGVRLRATPPSFRSRGANRAVPA